MNSPALGPKGVLSIRPPSVDRCTKRHGGNSAPQGSGAPGPGLAPPTRHHTIAAGSQKRLADCTTRPCMCCRRPFPSEGIGNRLCDECRKRDAGLSGQWFGT